MHESPWNAKALIERAVESSGLTELGGAEFEAALDNLLVSVKRDANLNRLGRSVFLSTVNRLLNTRLRVQHYLRASPRLVPRPIDRPLIVIGLPRSGTTFLHRLLAQDPRARALQKWEMWNVLPPPKRDSYANDPRRGKPPEGLIDKSELNRKHVSDWEDYEECAGLMANTFKLQWGYHVRATEYEQWLLSQDFNDAYVSYKEQVEILCSDFSAEVLVLKDPRHMFALDALFEVFPSARLVWLYRDPVVTIPSFCSLMSSIEAPFTTRFDWRSRSAELLHQCAMAAERALSVRKRLSRESVLDVGYGELCRDAVQTCDRIYRYFGIRMTAEARTAMAAWLGSKPAQQREHRYDLEAFGLDSVRIRDAFLEYSRCFEDRSAA